MLNASPGEIIAEVKMIRASSTDSILLLEGSSDVCFWLPRSHIGPSNVIPCGSKTNVTESIFLLERSGETGILGIVDDDLDRFFAESPRSNNLVTYDNRDLEATLLGSSSMESTLATICDGTKLDDFMRILGTPRAYMESVTEHFGNLRYVDRALGLNVPFSKLAPLKYVAADLTFSPDQLRQDFCELGGVTPRDVEAVASSIAGKTCWQKVQ